MIDGRTVGALLPAAGTGRRLGGDVAKQYLALDGEEVLLRTARLFEAAPGVDEIVVAAAPGEEERVRALLGPVRKLRAVVAGGAERQDSVENALRASGAEIVLVHDAARPFASPGLIAAVAAAAARSGAALAAVRAKETVKIADGSGRVLATPERGTLWMAQTPQGFAAALLREAYALAKKEGFRGTDDASLVERLGVAVELVEGEYDNIKITTPDDLDLAAKILARRGRFRAPS